MKTIAALLALLTLSGSALSEEFKLVDGRTIKGGITRLESGVLFVETEGGIEKVLISSFAPETKARYGENPGMVLFNDGRQVLGEVTQFVPAKVTLRSADGEKVINARSLSDEFLLSHFASEWEVRVLAGFKTLTEIQSKANPAIAEGMRQMSAKLERLVTENNELRARAGIVRTSPGQVPTDVALRIKADAIKEWPGNYRMQEYEIRNQTEAYLKVNK